MAQTGKLGTADSRLGDMLLAFAGMDAPLPSTGNRTGRFGTGDSQPGNIIFSLGGILGPNSIHLTAENRLTLLQSAGYEAVFLAHAPPAWALGGIDSRLGNMPLSFAGTEDPRPLSDTITGKLGTTYSLLGNMRPALGEEEGESNAGIINVSAGNVLSLAQSAGYQATFTRDAQCELSLNHSVSLTTILNLAANSTLALAQEAIETLDVIYSLSANSELELAHEIVATASLNLSAGSSIVLGQEVTGLKNTNEFELDAESTLDIQQDCGTAHTFDIAAVSPLLLSQGMIVGRPWHLSVESILQEVHLEFSPDRLQLVKVVTGLNNSAGVTRPQSPAVGNVIPLTQTASVVRVKPTAIDLSAESTIELIDDVEKNQSAGASTWLMLSQAATVDKCKSLESELELAIEAAVLIIRNRSAASILALTQSVTFSIAKSGVQYQYHPFIGEGAPNAPAPPPATLTGPLEGIIVPFQLLYPATGEATDFVILRMPDFGNKDRLSFNRVLRETRGGTLIVYADPIWPKIQTLALNFSGLPSVKARELLDFLDSHLGEEIRLMDWEHKFWRGVVTVSDDSVVQDGLDSFSASFEFEGELVPA